MEKDQKKWVVVKELQKYFNPVAPFAKILQNMECGYPLTFYGTQNEPR